MISITPQGQVYLCKTPLENDYKNQLTFNTSTEQETYFNSKVFRNLGDDDYTYIKKDNVIKIGLPIDDIIGCNYLFYKNRGFDSKIYYCFITDMEYINENCTAVTIETDVYQTYMFDIVRKRCFVEREHVGDDTIGSNTVPEGLDTGDYIVNDVATIGYENSSNPETRVVIGVTKVPKEVYSSMSTTNRQYNGILNGLTYYVFETHADAANFIDAMDLSGLADDIVNVFLAPNSLCNNSVWHTYTITIINFGSVTFDISFSCNKIPPESAARILKNSTTISMNSTLNGYTPKNNKLFTKEYNYLHVTNNSGGDINLAYEDFVNNTPTYRVLGAICPGCSIMFVPENYKKFNTSSNKNILMEYGLPAGKYPVCSWRSDTYTNWLTQNSVNYSMDKIGTIGGIGVAMAVNPGVAAIGGVGLINDLLQEKVKRETSPIQAKGNINVGDVTYASGMNKFTYSKMSCRYEYAKRIDDYFSMFGYKVNSVKLPNLTGRTNWNYVKTVDCNFEGDIPQIYLNKIKEIFNNGITLWHNPNTMLDYSQSNTIVS